MVQDGPRGLAWTQRNLGGVGVRLILFERSDRHVGERGIVRTSVNGVTSEAVTTSHGGGMVELEQVVIVGWRGPGGCGSVMLIELRCELMGLREEGEGRAKLTSRCPGDSIHIAR